MASPQPVKVKVCGLTNLPDAQTAVAAGADFLGFIFYPPSKRAVTPSTACAIVHALRAAGPCPYLVGVFVDEPVEAVAATLDEVGLDLAQLSGNEVPYQVADPLSPLFGRAYKGLRPTTWDEAEAEAEWYVADAAALHLPSLLVDTYHATLRGGTGETGDWALSARLARVVPRLMLAGGLTPNNVRAAVRQVQPFAVDVASGVESQPGQKDPAQVRLFVERARNALARPDSP